MNRIQRINPSFLKMLDCGLEILRVFIDTTQEDQNIICPRTVYMVPFGVLALETRWEDKELAAIHGNGTLPEIQQDALQAWRRVQYHWFVHIQIKVAHGVEDIGIGGRHHGPCVETTFPNGQDIVARTEDFL